jgi:hypothetical protein
MVEQLVGPEKHGALPLGSVTSQKYGYPAGQQAIATEPQLKDEPPEVSQ